MEGTGPLAATPDQADPACPQKVEGVIPLGEIAADHRPSVANDAQLGRVHRLKSTSMAESLAERHGLIATYRELLSRELPRRYGVPPERVAAFVGQTLQLADDTPAGFVQRAGDLTWPPNPSEGRRLRMPMTRSLTYKLRDGNGAILKIKGTGQTPGHPMGRATQINGQVPPPFPYPLLWGRDFERTGTTQFGLQAKWAEGELVQLLVIHALSKRLFGRFAHVPIPVDATRVEQVFMNGREVSIHQARADRRLWAADPSTFDRSVEDYFSRLVAVAPDAVGDAKSFAELKTSYGKKLRADLEKELEAGGFEGFSELKKPELAEAAAAFAVVRRFDEEFPMAQISMVEASPYRNNLVTVWSELSPHATREQLIEAMLRDRLAPFEPGPVGPASADRFDYAAAQSILDAALAPVAGVVKERVASMLKEIGQTYGMVRAMGANFAEGFHPKDIMGSEMTDWTDVDIPLPAGRDDPVAFRPLNDWACYMNGIHSNISCLRQLFRLDYDQDQVLFGVFADSARGAFLATVKAGLAGELDDLLGPEKDRWRDWIRSETEAEPSKHPTATLRDALRTLNEGSCTRPVGAPPEIP